jgi:peptide/nickel transport system permease protein
MRAVPRPLRTPSTPMDAVVEVSARLRALPRTNRQLTVGLAIILAIVLFGTLGPLVVDVKGAQVGSAMPDQPPSMEYLLGTDSVGRQILPAIVAGTPLTLSIGLIAGTIGLGVGVVFGLIAGYFGGFWDHTLRGAADVFLTVPSLLVLVVIASTMRGAVDITTEALVVSALAWMSPTRTIRSQMLSMRERGYVHVSRFSGMGGLEVVFKEVMPNLLPYLAASFVGAVATAILASIGLEALGLGPQNEPTLGMTIYWALYYAAVVRGLFWWWAAPITMIVLIFVGLFLISAGLDEIANPRLRRTV